MADGSHRARPCYESPSKPNGDWEVRGGRTMFQGRGSEGAYSFVDLLMKSFDR